MVVVKSVTAKAVLDSRREKTILVSVKTSVGTFQASVPNGKSRGKHEANPYKKSLEKDIETLRKFKDYFSDEVIENFDDLRRVEDIVEGHVGANTLFALESAILKALAKKNKQHVWQTINPNAKRMPRLVGNVVGGGKHSSDRKKPDFQEFLLVPDKSSVRENFEFLKKLKDEIEYELKDRDEKFLSKKNDENAWRTSLNEKEVLDIVFRFGVPVGLDVAATEFYKRKKYHYQNPMLTRTVEEQVSYISNLVKSFSIFYIEDPFQEESFESFSKILKKFPDSLIVGDDLTTTNIKRFQKAISEKSINAIIVKPNQNGSLLHVRDICELAKKHGIKIVFSHRSGETEETVLADLAFGFQADFFKCGITGKERESKIKRLIEIEKKINRKS